MGEKCNVLKKEIMQKFTCCCQDQDMEKSICNRIDGLTSKRKRKGKKKNELNEILKYWKNETDF